MDRAAQGRQCAPPHDVCIREGPNLGQRQLPHQWSTGECCVGDRQYRPVGRWLCAHGRTSGRLFAALGRACRKARRLRRQAPDRRQRRRAPHLGMRSLQDHAERLQVQAGLQEAHRHGEGRHDDGALWRPHCNGQCDRRRHQERWSVCSRCRHCPHQDRRSLPAATSGEANLTSMNGERRMRLTERYMDPPGQAMPDSLIAARIANNMERVLREQGKSAAADKFKGFDWKTEEDAFMDGYHNHEKGGEFVTYERLRTMGTNGFQEPAVDFKDGKIIGTKRLFADGKFGTKDGKAKFMETQWRGLQAPGKEAESKKFPFLINNGRANVNWQNAYLDQDNEFVMDRMPYPYIQMNPKDMDDLKLKQGDLVEIFNDNGSTQAMVYPTPTAKPKQTFMLFAYPTGVQGNVVSPGVNEFIIPNYKQTWANIRKLADAPEGVKHLSFKSLEYTS